MLLRFLFLTLVAVVIIRAIRTRIQRRSASNETRAQAARDLGVDPNAIRDAEFTDLGDRKETIDEA